MPRRKNSKRRARTTDWLFKFARVALSGVLAILILDAAYIFILAPDWDVLASGEIPKSTLIKDYQAMRLKQNQTAPIHWHPVPLQQISTRMQRAAIVAEDSHFYGHSGIDVQALKNAIKINIQERRIVYGASTITQQTAKNLFLNLSRNPLRKWHELWLTLWMERRLSKQRILELYLNIAQFGPGVFGVDAAARYYWNVSAHDLNSLQAAQLAASLPSPGTDNPATRTNQFQQRVARIAKWM